jgi:hypothetical protein
MWKYWRKNWTPTLLITLLISYTDYFLLCIIACLLFSQGKGEFFLSFSHNHFRLHLFAVFVVFNIFSSTLKSHGLEYHEVNSRTRTCRNLPLDLPGVRDAGIENLEIWRGLLIPTKVPIPGYAVFSNPNKNMKMLHFGGTLGNGYGIH